MSRQVLINTLREYFASKGGFMTVEEYKEAEDAPYRYQIVKRVVGTWARLKNLVQVELPQEQVEAKKPAAVSTVKPKVATKPTPKVNKEGEENG